MDSFCDKGTLKNLANVIRRTNLPKKVKDNVRAVQDFYSLLVDAHIVAAAMTNFGMSALDGKPADVAAPKDARTATLCSFLEQTVGKLVDRYALNFMQTQGMSSDETSQVLQTAASGEPDDRVLNYACQVIGFGLMAENFHDAWKEGDGQRLLRCWKFLLIHFREDGRTKYALEAFRLIAHTSALLSPRKAHQLIWNRTCNPKGGHGNNIPLDLQNEFLNRVFKDSINTFRSDITSRSIDRSSQSVKLVNEMLNNFDRVTCVSQDSGHHALPDTSEEFSLILRTLQKKKVFAPVPGRAHGTFKNINADPFVGTKKRLKELHKWLRQHRKKAAIEQALTDNKY